MELVRGGRSTRIVLGPGAARQKVSALGSEQAVVRPVSRFEPATCRVRRLCRATDEAVPTFRAGRKDSG
jgi:hypothetical protein